MNDFFEKCSSYYHRRRWSIFLILIVITLLPAFAAHLNKAHKLYHGVEKCERWLASQTWISSVNTYKETGVWLALKDKSGKVVPYDQLCCADDVGHALFLGFLGKGLDIDFTPLKIVYFNAYVNLFAILLAIAFFLRLRLDFIAGTILLIAIYYFIFVKGFYSPHYVGLGMVALISITPLALLAYFNQWCSKKEALTFAILGIILLGCATLMRSVLGYFGVATGLFILFYFIAKEWKQFRYVLAYLILGVAIIFAWLSPKWVTIVRDKTFSINQKENPFDKSVWEGPHGISHNLFIGLGVVPNKWGIEYEDLVGYEFAKKVDPSVIYVSNQHFKILRDLYFQYLKEDPLEVLRIYYEKAKIILKYPPMLISALLFPVFLLIGLSKVPLTRRKELPIFLVSTVGVLFFILQGLLAHPGRYYIGPGIFFSCIQCGLLLHYLVRRFEMHQRYTTQREAFS